MPLKTLRTIATLYDKDSYGACSYMMDELSEAFEYLGITVKRFKNGAEEALGYLIKDPVDLTISFMDSSINQRPLCSYTGIPHLSYLVDPSHCYLKHAREALSFISVIEPTDAYLLKKGGFKNAFVNFLGVNPRHLVETQKEKPVDILFLGSAWGYKEAQEEWYKRYDKKLAHILDAVAHKVIVQPECSHLSELLLVLQKKGYDIEKVPYADMQVLLGIYVRGYERVNLLKSIKKHAVHIYGGYRPKRSWEELLKGQSNLIFHPPCSYKESLVLSSKAKILLNSSPQFKYGLHDRLFTAPIMGAGIVSYKTPGLVKYFPEGSYIDAAEALDDKLECYLTNPSLLQESVYKAQQCVLKDHTWEKRAETILKNVGGML